MNMRFPQAFEMISTVASTVELLIWQGPGPVIYC